MRSQRDRASKAREDTHDMQLIFAALAAVTLALPQRDNVHQGQGRGQGQGQGQGVGDTTFAVQSGARLDVNNFGGEIVVKTWNQNTVQVHSSHSSRSQVNVSASGSTVLVRTEGRRGPPDRPARAIRVAWPVPQEPRRSAEAVLRGRRGCACRRRSGCARNGRGGSQTETIVRGPRRAPEPNFG